MMHLFVSTIKPTFASGCCCCCRSCLASSPLEFMEPVLIHIMCVWYFDVAIIILGLTPRCHLCKLLLSIQNIDVADVATVVVVAVAIAVAVAFAVAVGVAAVAASVAADATCYFHPC